MANRTRAYNRDMSYRKACKRKRISDECGHRYVNAEPYYDNLHQYSKNKVHCSCTICSRKTKNKGKKRSVHGNYDRSYNWKNSDLRKIISMDDDELETLGNKVPVRRVQGW